MAYIGLRRKGGYKGKHRRASRRSYSGKHRTTGYPFELRVPEYFARKTERRRAFFLEW